MPFCLSSLPSELLTNIITHIDIARTLLHLALTCKRLHSLIERDGFRIFVQTRFPSIQPPPCWKDAALALTNSSRAWDRKAFVARRIKPEGNIVRLPRGFQRPNPRSRRRGQTMGYQPVIDSYDEQIGHFWASRREVLAWGAGAELIVRITGLGDEVEESGQQASTNNGIAHLKGARASMKGKQNGRSTIWLTYKENWHTDGRHDITSVNLLRPSQQPRGSTVQVIIGRASGGLDHVRMLLEGPSTMVTHFATHGRPVRAASINAAPEPILAACLSDGIVALYNVGSNSSDTNPYAEISVIPPGKAGRTWSSRFLNSRYLAVGLGPSSEPVHIYDISVAGTPGIPFRTFGITGTDVSGPGIDRINATSTKTAELSSVYPVVPLDRGENLLLSGCYDGSIRLHDLRSPNPYTATYDDPMDNSPIYSLLPTGLERFLAGGARHSIVKAFDLRMPGGKVYYAADVEPCSSQTLLYTPPKALPRDICCPYHHQTKHARRNFNLYLHARTPTDPQSQRRRADSPIYALSAPSAYSPSVYIGLENDVVQLDLVSLMDRYFDPVFANKLGGKADRISYVTQEHVTETVALALQEQSRSGETPLMKQGPLFSGGRAERYVGWDERWMDGRGMGTSKPGLLG